MVESLSSFQTVKKTEMIRWNTKLSKIKTEIKMKYIDICNLFICFNSLNIKIKKYKSMTKLLITNENWQNIKMKANSND